MNAFSNAGAANADAGAVLEVLRQQDQLLTQGTLTYRRHLQRASSEGVFSLVGTDSNERQRIGSRDDVRRFAEAATNSLEDGEITVTKEGHFWHCITKLDLQSGEPLADRTMICVYDGQDERILFSKQVTLTAHRFSERGGRSINGLYPAPCYVLGRGLSLLSDIRIEQRDGTLLLTGSRVEKTYKTHIEAELDASHGYMARRIVQKRADGTVLGTTELDSPITMGECFVASHSFHAGFYRTPTEPMHKDEYTVLSAAAQPRAVDFSPVLKKGTLVMDCRTPRAIKWELEEDETPAQLLPRSQQQYEAQMERQAKYEARIAERERLQREADGEPQGESPDSR